MDKFEPLDSHYLNTVPYDELVNKVNALENRMVKLGIRVSSSSRIANYRRVLNNFLAIAQGGDLPKRQPNLKLFHQGMYEIEQLMVIVNDLSSPPEVQGWKQKVQIIVSGKDLPEDEERKTTARDLQFELFTAALCRRAGYSILLEEPDVVVKHPISDFGIAAKRIKSVNKLSHRIKKAKDQILKSEMDGVICLDVTPLHNPTNAFMIVEDPQIAINEVQRIADHFLHRNVKKIRSLIGTEEIFGFMVFMGSLFYIPTKSQLGRSTRWSITNLCGFTDKRYDLLRSFVMTFTEGALEA
jgi:hypothetical protein